MGKGRDPGRVGLPVKVPVHEGAQVG